jgi:hypothetical protein
MAGAALAFASPCASSCISALALNMWLTFAGGCDSQHPRQCRTRVGKIPASARAA